MKLLAATYNCFAKAINLTLYEFTGVKKPLRGMFREYERRLLTHHSVQYRIGTSFHLN